MLRLSIVEFSYLMKKYLYVRASIYVVIAILAIIFSNFFLQNIRFTITSVMIMYGVDDLILHFFLDKNKKAKLLLLWSVIDILLGVLVMSLVSDITTIYIIWATWCLLRSIVEAIEFIFERRKDISILRALGANRKTVFLTILLETLIIAVIGAILGFIIAHIAIGIAGNYAAVNYGINISGFSVQKSEVFVLIGAVLLSVLAGIIPAVMVYRTDATKYLK